jgi:putative membrane protein
MVNVHDALVKDKERLESAIAEAESGTSGEILVAFAHRAGNYEREIGYFSFGVALALMAALWAGFHRLSIPWAFGALFVGYLIGQLFGHLIPALPMLMVPKAYRLRKAEKAALITFHDLHVSTTRAHTGVLLLIAQAERAVVVLGDGPISSNIAAEEWEGVRDQILAGIRAGKPTEGLLAGIQAAGALLAKHFPATGDNANELANGVYFIK